MSKSSHQIKGLSLDRLETLAKVVRQGGVVRAAAGDANRQSLFSRQIHELESAMNVTLMDRSSSPHQPTAAAMALVESTEALFRQFQLLREQTEEQRAEVIIGAGDRMIRSYLMPFLAKQSHVGIRAVLRNLTSSAIRAGLISHSIHLGILRSETVPEMCKAVALKPIRVGFYAPLSMKDETSKNTWKLLIATPLVRMEGENRLWHHWQQSLDAHGIQLDAALECSSWFQVAESMKIMQLAGFLPVDVAHSYGNVFFECKLPCTADYYDNYSIAWSSAMAKKHVALSTMVERIGKAASSAANRKSM